MILILSLIACGSNTESSNSIASSIAETETQAETKAMTLTDLENYFVKKDIFIGEHPEKSAEMISAISGTGIEVEIYEYAISRYL